MSRAVSRVRYWPLSVEDTLAGAADGELAKHHLLNPGSLRYSARKERLAAGQTSAKH